MNKEEKQKIKDWIWQKKFRTYIGRSALMDLDEFQDFISAMPEESEQSDHTIEHCGLDCDCPECEKYKRKITKRKWKEWSVIANIIYSEDILVNIINGFPRWLNAGCPNWAEGYTAWEERLDQGGE